VTIWDSRRANGQGRRLDCKTITDLFSFFFFSFTKEFLFLRFILSGLFLFICHVTVSLCCDDLIGSFWHHSHYPPILVVQRDIIWGRKRYAQTYPTKLQHFLLRVRKNVMRKQNLFLRILAPSTTPSHRILSPFQLSAAHWSSYLCR
jgi:hypothetical protein